MKQVSDFFNKYKEIAYKKNDVIIQPNETPSSVYFVKSGVVRLYTISKNGNEITFNLLKPGAYFSMMSILNDSENKYFFEALTNVTVSKAPKPEFLKFINDEQPVLMDLTKRVLSGLNGLLYSVENLLSAKASDRISSVLSVLAKRFGKNGKNGEILIDLALTHQQIANIAGLTRETTSIEMGRLAKRGIISYHKRVITIKDLESLEEELSASSESSTSPIAL